MQMIASHGPVETQRIARGLMQRYRDCRPLIIALVGELGSGKTTFVQGLARALGIGEKIQSPTFVLMKWYELSKRFRPKKYFVHIDAYRLNAVRDAKHLGLRELFGDPSAIIVIEWAERIRSLIPRYAIWVTFHHSGRNKRTLKIRNPNADPPAGRAGIRNKFKYVKS